MRTKRNCIWCGYDITNRRIVAKICTSKKCKLAQQRVCARAWYSRNNNKPYYKHGFYIRTRKKYKKIRTIIETPYEFKPVGIPTSNVVYNQKYKNNWSQLMKGMK